MSNFNDADYAARGIPECIIAESMRGLTDVSRPGDFSIGGLWFRPGSLDARTAPLVPGAAEGDPAIIASLPDGRPADAMGCRHALAAAPRFFAKFFADAPVARARALVCPASLLALVPDMGASRAAAGGCVGAIPLPLPRRRLRLGVLGSGSGSNMQSIQDAIEAGTLDAEIVTVITDVPGARILERAARHGIPARHVDHAPFRTKLEGRAEDEVVGILKDAGADVVVLAGYMRVVKAKLLAAFPDRVINIHPALLPSFPGIAGWKQALDYGAKIAGCTVHFVNAGIDSGPVIVQRAVPVEDADTPESLHARIQVQEHLAYPEALRLISEDRLAIYGRRVVTF